jgi:DNA-binding transcriptional MerR regulator
MGMGTLVTIGVFSRMTHLSIKTLRHYHDLGLLEPAAIDPFSGYRSYDTSQVPTAQVIRRLRDLTMPLDQIRAVLTAPDVGARNQEITAHLDQMERQLMQTQSSVRALRALLAGPVQPAVELRTIPAVTTLAIEGVVDAAEMAGWAEAALEDLSAAMAGTGLAPAGPPGALYPPDFYELERSETTLFVPVQGADGASGTRPALPPGRARWQQIPAIEAAVIMHEGPFDDIDRTYGALGTVVAERAIGVDGPIREYYVVSFGDTDDEEQYRTEVCWPVFLTAAT